MGEASNASSGLQSKAARLLNKKTFSDLEIHVKDGVLKKVFPAHKLFLAMNSRVFSEMFYSKSPSESPKEININDYTPDIVFLMLRYMYTYKIDVNTEEARQLYTLSKKFGIRSLQEFCVNFISDKELSKDNVLYMYECALREKFTDLLSKCQEVVSIYTKFVFDSPSFVETPSAVVEDILQLEALAVDNEIDVLNAVVKWSHYECKRQKLPVTSANVRQCIIPFLPKLRFLTLNMDQFSDFSKTHNFLNAHEIIAITTYLLRPDDVTLSLPFNICSLSEPRVRPNKLPQIREEQATRTNLNLNLISSRSTSPRDNKTFRRFSYPQKHNFNHNETSNNDVLPQDEKTDVLIYPHNNILHDTSNGALSSHYDKGDVKIFQQNICNSSYSSFSHNNDKTDTTVCLPQKKNHDNVLNNSLLADSNVSLIPPAKNIKTPISSPKREHEKFKAQNKTYEIQLHLTQKMFNMAFKNDVKCSMTLHLLKGAIQINIIELKICQESEAEESINVYLQVSYSNNNSSKSDAYTTVLKNSLLQLTFDKPLRVFENNHVEIEVTIEDLLLNRCCIIKNPICELKQGTDLVADVALTSNQMNKDGEYFFLISRVIYDEIS